MKTFKSILQFAKEFDTDEKCRLYLEEQRWNGIPACPHCGSINVCRFANGNGIFKCREKQCRKKFSVTVGTVYQDRKLPLTKIFLAVYVLSVHSKGISSLQLANLLDISQKAAWLLNHKIRAMLANNAPEVLSNMVEADETLIGGKVGNRHKSKRKKNANGYTNPLEGKTPVLGMVERGGKVITKVVDKVKWKELQLFIRSNVAAGSTLNTDELAAYGGLSKDYNHVCVQHGKGEYVRGEVYTNTIEGFWSLLKRQINGIHHFVSPKHLQRYCNEASYRYNNKGVTQDERFANVLRNCNGSLQYKELIAV